MLLPSQRVTLKNGKVLELRSPLPTDAKEFISCHITIFSESPKNMNSSKARWEKTLPEDQAKFFESMASAPRAFMLCAFDGETMVGTLGISQSGQGEYILESGVLGMCIKEAYQDLGLGQAMMSYALTEAKKAGFHHIELQVRTFNTSGIKLYEKMGFKRLCVLSQVAFIEGQYYDSYLYEKIL